MAGEEPRAVRRRGFLEIRWRQFRNAPRPVVRAVVAALSVATTLGLAYLAYDVAISRGVDLPGGDLRSLAVLAFIVIVLGVASLVTYLLVPQAVAAGGRQRRNWWSGVLGFLAAVPIAYVVLVLESQLLRPLLT